MASRTIDAKVPEGTDSEDWLAMSARVAWVLWLADRRAKFPVDETEEKRLWQEQAADYRAHIRKSLRNLQREGISLVRR